MPRVIENHEQIIEAFQNVDIVSELVEKLPNGEFKNELDMDIILFGRSYRGKQVGPYTRLLEFQPDEVIVKEDTWESSIFYILVSGRLDASVTEQAGEIRGNVKRSARYRPVTRSAKWPCSPARHAQRRSR